MDFQERGLSFLKCATLALNNRLFLFSIFFRSRHAVPLIILLAYRFYKLLGLLILQWPHEDRPEILSRTFEGQKLASFTSKVHCHSKRFQS